MQWCHWQCCQHYVMLTLVSVVSQDQHFMLHFQLSWPNKYSGTINDSFGVTWCKHQYPLVSRDQKSNFAPHLNHLDLMKAVVPLILVVVPLTTTLKLHKASARTSGVTWPKSGAAPHFNLLGLIPLTMLFGNNRCWCQHQWHYITKKSTHFNYDNLRNARVPLMTLSVSYDNKTTANGIT